MQMVIFDNIEKWKKTLQRTEEKAPVNLAQEQSWKNSIWAELWLSRIENYIVFSI